VSERAPGAGSTESHPPPAHRLAWEPHTRFRPIQYVITLGTPVLFRLIDGNTREAAQPRWQGPVLFDAAARELLRIEDRGAQRSALRLSDYGWYGAMAWPLADAVVVALVLDQNLDVAWQLSALALQAYALSGFVTLLTIKATARERPASYGCQDPGCSLPARAFPSGHTAGAFAGAGLVCASHLNLPLYGSPLADRAACIGALTVASATAVLRVAAERHYASDVIVGAGVGSVVGYVLPTLFQYATSETSERRLAVVPAGRGAYLLTYGGSF
jgi:membrane-associated phospholipid phosphatase